MDRGTGAIPTADGTAASARTDPVDADVAAERLRECGEVQDPITQAARDALVGRTVQQERSLHSIPLEIEVRKP